MNGSERYEWLDAAAVLAALAIIAGTVLALVFVDIPQNNLPIIASLVSALLGTIVGGYAGFRWGSSLSSKANAEKAQDALARVAVDRGVKEP